MNTMTIQEWLDTPCDPNELSYNKDGSAFLPIRAVKEKLGLKHRITSWELKEYTSSIFNIGKEYFIRAYGVLEVIFADNSMQRKPGGTTFRIGIGSNQFYENTAISEVIKNAAKNLGNQFGFHLNQDLTKEDLDLSDMPPFPTYSKPKADAIILRKLQLAKDKGDQQIIKEIEDTYDICSQ